MHIRMDIAERHWCQREDVVRLEPLRLVVTLSQRCTSGDEDLVQIRDDRTYDRQWARPLLVDVGLEQAPHVLDHPFDRRAHSRGDVNAMVSGDALGHC